MRLDKARIQQTDIKTLTRPELELLWILSHEVEFSEQLDIVLDSLLYAKYFPRSTWYKAKAGLIQKGILVTKKEKVIA